MVILAPSWKSIRRPPGIAHFWVQFFVMINRYRVCKVSCFLLKLNESGAYSRSTRYMPTAEHEVNELGFPSAWRSGTSLAR